MQLATTTILDVQSLTNLTALKIWGNNLTNMLTVGVGTTQYYGQLAQNMSSAIAFPSNFNLHYLRIKFSAVAVASGAYVQFYLATATAALGSPFSTTSPTGFSSLGVNYQVSPNVIGNYDILLNPKNFTNPNFSGFFSSASKYPCFAVVCNAAGLTIYVNEIAMYGNF